MFSCLYDYVCFSFSCRITLWENHTIRMALGLGITIWKGVGGNVYSISIGIDLQILYHRL